ncbi:MAG: TIGR03668 family PPOX class F420-dependent oxidoreductase [Chloroflexi bacterium]|nr:TIGR03668 family PPOX class F420-dependent oxidoreductase [Chloroflexota bacterium]
MPKPSLSPAERAFIESERRGVLATMGADGRPRLVPICYVVGDGEDALGRTLVYSPLDEKPKRTRDPRQLQRVRDLLVLPTATILVDRWDEDWTRLGWLRCYGVGELIEPEPREVDEHRAAIAALREKYPQYRTQNLEGRPMIRIRIDRTVSWGNLEAVSPSRRGRRTTP